MIRKFIAHPLFWGSAVMIVGSNLNNVFNYAYHLLMGRLMTPEVYGELAALFTLMSLLGMVPSSLALVVVRTVSQAKDNQEVGMFLNWLDRKVLLMTTVVSLGIIGSSFWLASFLNIHNYWNVVLIAIIFFFSIPAFFYKAALQGLLRFQNLLASILLESFVKLFLGVLLVYYGFSVWGAMVAYIAAAFIGWQLCRLFLKKYRTNTISHSINLKSLVRYSVPVAIQSIAMTALLSTDLILVKHYFSAYDAGIYAALSTLGKIIFYASGAISGVMFPLISQRQARQERYTKIFMSSLLMTGGISVVILTFYALFPNLAITVLYGNRYLSAGPLLASMGLYMTLYTLSALLVNYYLSLEKTGVSVFPLVAVIVQIVGISLFHQSLQQVLYVLNIEALILLVCILVYALFRTRIRKN